MKTVNYRGMTFEIEDRFQYIATDADGSIFAFANEPFIDEVTGEWFCSGGDVKCLKKSDNGWSNSLENC